MKRKTCPLHPTKWNHLLLTVLLKIPLNYLFWMGLLLALANRTCCCLNIKQFTARELFCFIRYFQIFTNIVKYWVDIDSLKKKKKRKSFIHSSSTTSLFNKNTTHWENMQTTYKSLSAAPGLQTVFCCQHIHSHFTPPKKQKQNKLVYKNMLCLSRGRPTLWEPLLRQKHFV